MLVQDLMSKDVVTCGPNDALNVAAQRMWERNCGAIPIVDEGRTLAMITDRDVCMAAYTQGRPLSEISVASAMSRRVVTCSPFDAIGVAEEIMRTEQIRRLPVVDRNGALVGLLSLGDIATHGRIGRRARAGHDDLGADAIASTLSGISAPATQPGIAE